MSAAKSRLEGTRKLIGYVVGVVAVVLLAWMRVEYEPAFYTVAFLFVALAGGNVGEWAAKRPPKPAPGAAP